MMAAPRRAAAADDAPEAVAPLTAPRRGLAPLRSPRRVSRIVLAPLAALSVTGLAAGLIVLPRKPHSRQSPASPHCPLSIWAPHARRGARR